MALAEIVKKIKQSSSFWLKKDPRYPKFHGWAHGYFAGSIGPSVLDKCRHYILNQEAHHNARSLQDEMEAFSNVYQLEWYPDEWTEED